MARVVALLDIDHTLLFDGHLNIELLNALERRGITDIYLFTDMVFSTSSIRERQNLIHLLQERGFTVHGVMTPADLAWNLPEAEAVGVLKTWCKRFEGEEFISHLKEKYPNMHHLIEIGYQPESCVPGLAYQEASTEYDTNYMTLEPDARKRALEEGRQLISFETSSRSNSAKMVAEQFLKSGLTEYTHVKGFMLDNFLRHLPSWIERIVIADDNPEVNDTILNFKPFYGDTYVPPITMMHVQGLSDSSWCDEQLAEFFVYGKKKAPQGLYGASRRDDQSESSFIYGKKKTTISHYRLPTLSFLGSQRHNNTEEVPAEPSTLPDPMDS